MPKISRYTNSSQTYSTPRRPYESERIDRELKIIGTYGLKNKREVWRVQLTLAKIRKTARELLTLAEDDPKRILEGAALLRRMKRLGLLDDEKNKIEYVLQLKVEDFLERRLQTIIFKEGIAKSIHQARVLIRQRHIRVGKQVVNIPSFLVRVDSEKHISWVPSSALNPNGTGKLGRKAKKKTKSEKKEEVAE